MGRELVRLTSVLTGKEYTLNRVLNRFGSNCTYIVVGKSPDEQQLSQKVGAVSGLRVEC